MATPKHGDLDGLIRVGERWLAGFAELRSAGSSAGTADLMNVLFQLCGKPTLSVDLLP